MLVLGIGGVLGGGVWRSSGPRLDVGIDELDIMRNNDGVKKRGLERSSIKVPSNY